MTMGPNEYEVKAQLISFNYRVFKSMLEEPFSF